jgi:hypothetical protein
MGLFPKNLLEYVALQGIPVGPKSNIFLVDPVNGSDSNSGANFKQPLLTLTAAKAKCTTGQHDTVLTLAGYDALSLTAALDWNLNLTHLVGIGAPTPYGKRTRIISGADNLSPLLTVSGYGCIFKNLRIVHEQTADTDSLVCVKVTGARNFFENVEFAGNGTASSAIDGGASLEIAGAGAGENYFKDCVIGLDTVVSATGLFAMVVSGSGAARCRFDRCIFAGYAGHANAGLVEVMDGTSIDRAWVFRDCEFINLGSSTMASAFLFHNPDARWKRMFLINCWGMGFTDWDKDNSGMLFSNMDIMTPGGVSGYLLASVVT